MFGLQLPVGVGSSNKSHDVTLIQIVFFYLTHQTKWGPKPLYEGRIDGRFGPKTEAALATFLTRVGRPADRPRIESSGPNYDALKKALPKALIGLDCVPETNQAFCDCKGQPGADGFARETMTKIPLPKKEREALAKFQTDMGSGMGLGVALENRGVSAGGSFTATLVTPNAIWFDPQHKRFRDNDIPGPARQFLRFYLQKGQVWKAEASMALDIRSVKQYPALRNVKPLTQTGKQAIGATTPMNDSVAEACLAACAKIAAVEGPAAASQQTEMTDLEKALEPFADRAVRNLRQHQKEMGEADRKQQTLSQGPLKVDSRGYTHLAQVTVVNGRAFWGKNQPFTGVTFLAKKGQFKIETRNGTIPGMDGDLGRGMPVLPVISFKAEYWDFGANISGLPRDTRQFDIQALTPLAQYFDTGWAGSFDPRFFAKITFNRASLNTPVPIIIDLWYK